MQPIAIDVARLCVCAELTVELQKKQLTVRDAWTDSGGSKKTCIRWAPDPP